MNLSESLVALARAARVADLSHPARAALLTLIEHVDDRGHVTGLTYAALARWHGVSPKVAGGLIRELRRAGFLRLRISRPGGTRWNHDYDFTTTPGRFRTAPTRPPGRSATGTRPGPSSPAGRSPEGSIIRTKDVSPSLPQQRRTLAVVAAPPEGGRADPEHLHHAVALADVYDLRGHEALLAVALTAGWAIGHLQRELARDMGSAVSPRAVRVARLRALGPPERPVVRDPRLADRPRVHCGDPACDPGTRRRRTAWGHVVACVACTYGPPERTRPDTVDADAAGPARPPAPAMDRAEPAHGGVSPRPRWEGAVHAGTGAGRARGAGGGAAGAA